jgi:hypothetical protein
MDFISLCNVKLIYDLNFKRFYLGLDVGLGLGRAEDGRADDGRDGLPQAPQALMLSFILIYFFICLYLPILIIDFRFKVSHRLTNEWGFVFLSISLYLHYR